MATANQRASRKIGSEKEIRIQLRGVDLIIVVCSGAKTIARTVIQLVATVLSRPTCIRVSIEVGQFITDLSGSCILLQFPP